MYSIKLEDQNCALGKNYAHVRSALALEAFKFSLGWRSKDYSLSPQSHMKLEKYLSSPETWFYATVSTSYYQLK